MLTDKKLNAKLGKFKKTEMVYIINRQFKMLGIDSEISSDLEKWELLMVQMDLDKIIRSNNPNLRTPCLFT